MADALAGTPAIQDYLTQNQAQTNTAVTSAQNRDTVSPQGQTNSSITSGVNNSTSALLGGNPIIAAGTDIINSTVTTAVQGLAAGAIHQASGALKPLQTASDAFFTTLALASVASVEIAMELARGNARLVVSTIQQKQQTLVQLQTEVQALYNAVNMMLNSSPFINAYLQKLLQAYQLILQGDNALKSVVAGLEAPTNPTYNASTFNQAMALLNQAEALILPDPTANISQIRSATLQAATTSITSAKNTLATALVIPGISAKIASLMITYATQTLEINTLINLYLTALNDFISAYKRSPTVDQATINHITSGTNQLDSLLTSMSTLLNAPPAQRSSPLYPTTVTANATVWGVQLAAIIQWLLINPGAGSAVLNVTSTSVQRYTQSVALLNSYNNIVFGTATLESSQSQENVLNTGEQVIKFLFDANTLVATSKDPRNVKAEMQQFLYLIQASQLLCTDIINALTPFINTPNELIAGAASVIGNLTKTANSLGMDRVASLISTGSVAALFATNATTATYVGAALVGVRSITSCLNSSPTATDQDIAKVAAVDASLTSQNAVKQVEASRSATDSTATFVANAQAQNTQVQQQGQTAIAVGQKHCGAEAASTSPLSTISGSLKNITGNTFGNL